MDSEEVPLEEVAPSLERQKEGNGIVNREEAQVRLGLCVGEGEPGWVEGGWQHGVRGGWQRLLGQFPAPWAHSWAASGRQGTFQLRCLVLQPGLVPESHPRLPLLR